MKPTLARGRSHNRRLVNSTPRPSRTVISLNPWLILKSNLRANFFRNLLNIIKFFIVRSKVKTTGFSRSDLSLKPFARVGKRDGLSIR